MFVIVSKIFFIGSLIGMAVIILRKTTALKALKVVDGPKGQISFNKTFNIVKGKSNNIYSISKNLAITKIAELKDSAAKRFFKEKKEKNEVNLSEDYWENI